MLANACEPVREVMEMSVEGVSTTALLTSYNNKTVSIQLKRFYILDRQATYEAGGMEQVLAEPYRKIISSP